MKTFAKELGDMLSEDLKLSQTDFAERIGMAKPKLCRLLKGSIQCNRSTLDTILSGLPEELRARLVNAYLRDHASPLALGYLRGKPEGTDWSKFEGANTLSRKERAVLQALLNSNYVSQVGKILTTLAETLGIQAKA